MENLLDFFICLRVTLGALCLSSSCKVDSIHVGLFLVLGSIIASTCSYDGSSSSLGCYGEHVLSSLVFSCSSSSLESMEPSMEPSIEFLNAILSSKVMSLLTSTFYCPRT